MQLVIMPSLKENPHFDLNDEVREYRNKGPRYATEGSCAMDLRANIKDEYKLWPGQRQLVPTGLKIWIGSDYYRKTLPPGLDIEATILARSGLGSKYGIILGNGTGLVDTDYQGEILISVWNSSEEEEFIIKPTDRICQLKFNLVYKPAFTIVDEFVEQTVRGDGGFGHTGV